VKKEAKVKKRNLQLHLILTSKRTSGASGKHKDKRKKIEKKIKKEEFYSSF
jgi:hypothetical protein